MVASALAAAMLAAGAARAADTLATGPLPAWVHPAPAAQLQPPAAVRPGDAHILLSDQQYSFSPGVRRSYVESAVQLSTPAAVAGGGNVSFAWNPETDTPVVHKLAILRGGRTIDVLATQKFTVVRRETNLERAALDGMLTATIQPEGLQPGDVLDFALSITSHEPTTGTHVEAVSGGWNQAPIDHAHFRAEWPAAIAMQVKVTGGLPALVRGRAAGLETAEFTAADLQPQPPPNGAPARYITTRLIELSDYGRWSDLATVMAPLYVKAAAIPADGPLAAEVARIRAASSDPQARAEAALADVQEQVRYLYLGMNAGNLLPADAGATWARRFGDCKAKTALLLGMLRALGIDAVPALASAELGDGVADQLPMVAAFDHVLVRATIAGRTYWLDGTRGGDTRLQRVRVPDLGWVLPLAPRAAELVRLEPPPFDEPSTDTVVQIDGRRGLMLPVPFTVTTVMRGDAGYVENMKLKAVAESQLDRTLRDYWRNEYSFVEPEKVAASFDPATGEERLTMTGTARLEWKDGWYETDGTGLGWEADFHRDPGPDRDAPFATDYPFFTRGVETILLPQGFDTGTIERVAPISRTIAGYALARTQAVDAHSLTITATTRAVAPEFAAADAPAAQAALRELYHDGVYLHVPDSYRPTPAEQDAILAVPPATALDYARQAAVLIERDRPDEARAKLDAGLALEPRNVGALGMRAFLRAAKDPAGAQADYQAVLAQNGADVAALVGLAQLALARNDPKEALARADRVLAIRPGLPAAYAVRAKAYRRLDDRPAALAAAKAWAATRPIDPEAYLALANLQRQAGDNDAVAHTAAELLKDGTTTFAYVAAARMDAAIGHDAEAMAAFGRALALEPEAYIYVNRSQVRPYDDQAGRLADLDAALKLNPELKEAATVKAWLLLHGGRYAEAVQLLTPMLGKHADDIGLRNARGIAYARTGAAALAAADFAVARQQAGNDAWMLNAICYDKAEQDAALDQALAECDAALAIAPKEAAILDSRAYVLLRMGRLADALAAYDKVLAVNPKEAASLFGRAVVHAREGDAAGARQDAAAARALSPKIDQTFGYYGVAL